MSSAKFYWVIKGREPGLYRDWESCKAQVYKFSGAQYKSFALEQDYLAAKANFASQNDNCTATPTITSHDKQTALVGDIKDKYEAKDPKMKNNLDKDQSTVVYTDGACQTVCGERLAGVGVWFGPNDERNISSLLPGELQTNQRAELYAAIAAMTEHSYSKSAEQHLIVVTDSKYLVEGMLDWTYRWESRNEWPRIKNADLWQRLVTLRNKLGQVSFVHVKGHSGNVGNEAADKLATTPITTYRRSKKKHM